MNKMQKVVQKAMSVPCDPRYLEEVRKMVRESLSETTISDREKSLIVVAVDEAVGSIIGYGRERNLDSEVAVSVDIDDVRFKATVADSLNAFDLNGGLTEHQIADRVNKEKQHKLGIFLIRAIMDEITYNYKKGFENELELIRFL
ncbi:MAG: hypothetical protein A2Z34_10305 [Planctomycetes bacterium RBG_16_59_8]|nr:MAG: hypothetical protein A2Z34_10305 [Planctomycetes bacterium RBG_16_59_8]